jgi:hypothetical protein
MPYIYKNKDGVIRHRENGHIFTPDLIHMKIKAESHAYDLNIGGGGSWLQFFWKSNTKDNTEETLQQPEYLA